MSMIPDHLIFDSFVTFYLMVALSMTFSLMAALCSTDFRESDSDSGFAIACQWGAVMRGCRTGGAWDRGLEMQ